MVENDSGGRRAFLRAAVAAGVTASAGCIGGDGAAPETGEGGPGDDSGGTGDGGGDSSPPAASGAVPDGITHYQTSAGRVGRGTGPTLAEGPSEAWTFGTASSVFHPPAVVDGTVYLATYGGRLYAIDARTGEEQWAAEAPAPLRTPAVVDGSVFTCTAPEGDYGGVYSFDSETGEERWSTEVEARSVFSPAVVDGVVYAANDAYDGDVAAYDAADGSELWRATTDSAADAPAVADGTVYTQSHDMLTALDATSGEVSWHHEANRRIGGATNAPTVTANGVYASYPRSLVALSRDGEERWTYEGGPVEGGPAAGDGVLYLSVEGSSVRAIDEDDGRQRWVTSFDGDNASPPTYLDGTVYCVKKYVTSVHLVALDAGDGSERWRRELSEDIELNTLVVAGGMAFALSENNRLVAFGPDTA